MTYDIALSALADPTRRAIVAALRDSPQPVGGIAQSLPVSRPAVSQHLRVLAEAGLVSAQPSGTQRIYRLAPEGWVALRDYLDSMWDDALLAYAREAQKMAERTKP
ncbi:MAG: metalloregulator ArsR/SmtB family transcription factor [Pseudomonadota bacterium]